MRIEKLKPQINQAFNAESVRMGLPYRMTWNFDETLGCGFYGEIYIELPETHWFKGLFSKTVKKSLAVFETEEEIYLGYLTDNQEHISKMESLLSFAERESGREIIIQI